MTYSHVLVVGTVRKADSDSGAGLQYLSGHGVTAGLGRVEACLWAEMHYLNL